LGTLITMSWEEIQQLTSQYQQSDAALIAARSS
jgi:hypothetical protein